MEQEFVNAIAEAYGVHTDTLEIYSRLIFCFKILIIGLRACCSG